jgi:hypothetical protein
MTWCGWTMRVTDLERRASTKAEESDEARHRQGVPKAIPNLLRDRFCSTFFANIGRRC